MLSKRILFIALSFVVLSCKNPNTKNNIVSSDNMEVSNNLSENINAIINIIKSIRSKINSNTDMVYSEYDTAKELQDELDSDIYNLEKGNYKSLSKYKINFLPTSTFQEIAISNNWGDEYLKLASDFDILYAKIEEQIK